MVGKSLFAILFVGFLGLLSTDARPARRHNAKRTSITPPPPPPPPRTALIVVDVQNSFLPGGSLAVNGSDEILPIINRIIQACHFDVIIATQDWHNHDHISFASQHPGFSAFQVIPLTYRGVTVNQTLWPDHCVINSYGAQFSSQLPVDRYEHIVRKGYNREIDSYSGFADNGATHYTQLDSILSRKNIKRTVTVGLATDFCVQYTSIDSSKFQYQSYVIADAVRAVKGALGTQLAFEKMAEWGVKVENTADPWFQEFCPNYQTV